MDAVEFFRNKVSKVRDAAAGYDSGQIFNAIRARRDAVSDDPPLSIKDAELEVLTAKTDPIGRDHPDSVFYARTLTPSPLVGEGWGAHTVERVLLIHRLREVVAQVGFTRFEAVASKTDGEVAELDIGVERAALGADTPWLPAMDNRGEELFIGFQRDAIQDWLHRPAVIQRHEQLLQGFKAWLAEHPKSQREFPGADYLLLHTAETSCEQFNDFLDRTLVVPTVDQAAAAFFQDPL